MAHVHIFSKTSVLPGEDPLDTREAGDPNLQAEAPE